MKTRLITLSFILGFTVAIQAQNIHLLNSEQSTLQWEGYYTFTFSGHEGTIDFKEGHLSMQNDDIVGGYFIIDMTTLANTDGGYNAGLSDHLKNEDFFDVEKFPEAALNIMDVKYQGRNFVRIFADLTIMGITKPIEFYGEIDYDKKTLTTKFKIDRKRWGVTYKSSLKDNSLSDAMGFRAMLQF